MQRLDNFNAFNVGDTLTVAPDLETGGIVNQYMSGFAGRKVSIDKFVLDKDAVFIKEDPNKFYWTPRCFVDELPPQVLLSEFLL